MALGRQPIYLVDPPPKKKKKKNKYIYINSQKRGLQIPENGQT